MRVIIHSDEYYPTAQACTYRMRVLADAFLQAGDTVTVITSSANLKGNASKTEDRPERILYSPAVTMKKKTTVMRLLNNLSFGFTSVFTAVRAGKADVIITTSPPVLASGFGWLTAKFKRAKLVYDVRDIWPDVAVEMGSFSEDSMYAKLFGKAVRFMYKRADLITTVSPSKVKKLKKYAALYAKRNAPDPEERVWSVGNGFDETIADNEFDQSVVEEYELDRYFTCVYIGNIGLAQGLGALLDIAAKTKHKDVRFLCFGKGAEKEALEKRVADEGLTNIRFCGVIDHDKVFSLLKAAKISFIPLKSGKMKDSVPTKVYEALGIGCPVLLAAEGDSADIVDEAGMGVHISPDHTENIAELFDDMVDHYELYEKEKEHSVSLMREKYSRQKIAKEFAEELREYCLR